MICGGCGLPRGREACPTCDAVAGVRRAFENHYAEREGRRLGGLFRSLEVRELTLDDARRTVTRRAHRADAELAGLRQQLERVETRLGRALDELKQRDEEDERVIKMAGAALDAVEPAVKPCGYVKPCGTCPSCRYAAALAAHRERFPRST